jgi:hypothetical protein
MKKKLYASSLLWILNDRLINYKHASCLMNWLTEQVRSSFLLNTLKASNMPFTYRLPSQTRAETAASSPPQQNYLLKKVNNKLKFSMYR